MLDSDYYKMLEELLDFWNDEEDDDLFLQFMSSTHDFQKYIHEKLALDSKFTFKKMFGNYCLYSSKTPVALVCDNQLFIKNSDEAKKFLEKYGIVEEGIPFPSAKLWILYDDFENEEKLQNVLSITESKYKK